MEENYTVEELLEKYPYLKGMTKYALFIDKSEFDYIKNSPKIALNKAEIPEEFLKKILTDNRYYDYVLKFFNNEIKTFTVTYIINGDTGNTLNYNKSEIINGIIKLIKEEKIVVTEEIKTKYNTLINLISFNRFIEKYQNSNYDVLIENNNYSIPVSNFISFINLSNEEFNKIF